MGGFSGTVPEPTLAAIKALVHSGQLRFFLLSGTFGGAQTRYACARALDRHVVLAGVRNS